MNSDLVEKYETNDLILNIRGFRKISNENEDYGDLE
jgi:hypothetical protein